MKPKIYIDKEAKRIKILSDEFNEISITEAHSFIRDWISAVYDYHKQFPEEKVGNYVED